MRGRLREASQVHPEEDAPSGRECVDDTSVLHADRASAVAHSGQAFQGIGGQEEAHCGAERDTAWEQRTLAANAAPGSLLTSCALLGFNGA